MDAAEAAAAAAAEEEEEEEEGFNMGGGVDDDDDEEEEWIEICEGVCVCVCVCIKGFCVLCMIKGEMKRGKKMITGDNWEDGAASSPSDMSRAPFLFFSFFYFFS